MIRRPAILSTLAIALVASVAQAQQTQRWSESQGGPAYTQRWSETPTSATQTERQPNAGTAAKNRTNVSPAAARSKNIDVSSLPVVAGGKVPGKVEVRSGCDKQFASRNGPKADIRWFGVTQSVTLVGRRTDGELCALYDDGTSEWLTADRIMTTADRIMTTAEKQAHDQHMQALGAGLQRRQAGTGGTPQDMVDKLRATGNALHRETQEQYRQTEKYYEDRRRYGQ